MRTIRLGPTDLAVSQIAHGCMGFAGRPNEDQATMERRNSAAFEAALENNITMFDHADIYGGGACEENFGKLLASRPGLREKIAIQTKCAVRWGDESKKSVNRFDMSAAHITASVEGSLARLRTDYVDVLLMHHPDPLMEEESVEALQKLHSAGKIRHIGVSNFTTGQLDLFRSWTTLPVVANQVMMNCSTPDFFAAKPGRETTTHGLLEYCRRHSITLQAWSPLGQGRFLCENPHESLKALTARIAEIAAARSVNAETVAAAWLLRHPARIQPVIGSMNPARIRSICKATEIELTRDEWYSIINAATGRWLL